MNGPHSRHYGLTYSDRPLPRCPRCDRLVFEGSKGWLAKVRWEGGELFGHSGCLADVYRERQKDDPWYFRATEELRDIDEYDPAHSTAGAIWDQETQA